MLALLYLAFLCEVFYIRKLEKDYKEKYKFYTKKLKLYEDYLRDRDNKEFQKFCDLAKEISKVDKNDRSN